MTNSKLSKTLLSTWPQMYVMVLYDPGKSNEISVIYPSAIMTDKKFCITANFKILLYT
jgi:hypothetical protein